MNQDTIRELIELLIDPTMSQSYWTPRNSPTKSKVSLLCKDLLLKNELSLALPKSVLRSYIRQDRVGEGLAELDQIGKGSHTFKRMGGLSIYAFVALEVIPVKINGILIQEKLPEIMTYYDDIPKAKCWELVESLPFIFKAIIDYARSHALLNMQVNLVDFRFHLVDYRSPSYYICTKGCQVKIIGVT